MRVLQPRNALSSLNLLSQDSADYGPWSALGIGALPSGLLDAQAADRATATVEAATGTPTPVLVGSVPTAPLEVVPAPVNFPTPTPADAFILVQPTATPRPVGVLPTQPPATIPPLPTIVPDTVPPPPSATASPSATPTRTRPPNVEPTNTALPDATDGPVATVRTPVATATRIVEPTTAVPATVPPPTDTAQPATPTLRPTEPATATVPPPTETPTNVPPTNTPRPTNTNTPRPRPTDVPPTSVPPTDVPPTSVPPTATPTDVPPTATPTTTPTQTNVPGPADITVDKSGPTIILLNLDVTYLLTISNIGPGTATNVVLLDTPTGVPWTFVATGSDPACTSNGVTISCAAGTIAPGGSRSLTVTIRPSAVGQLNNTAEVSATELDPVPTNNTDTLTTMIAPAAVADLQITKSGPATASMGDTITYNLAVTNAGPFPASGVVAVDTPTGVSWTFNSGTAPGGPCTLDGGTAIRCPVGAIPAGTTVNVSVVLRVDSGGTLTNRADVSGAENDPDNTNNTSTVTTNVTATSIPGVTVSIAAAPATAQNNLTDVTYTITIANVTGAGLTFTLFDTAFTTYDVRGCTPSSGTCSPAVTQPGPLSWDGPVTVPTGGSITMDIVGRFVTAPAGQACFPSHTIVTSAGTAQRPAGSACVTIVP